MYKELTTDKEIKILLIKLRKSLTIIESELPEGKVPWDYDKPLRPNNMTIEKIGFDTSTK